MEANAKKRLTVLTITTSEAGTFRDCRRKWQLAYEQGLRPNITAKPFAFGHASHAGLEAAYRTIGTVPASELTQTAAAAAAAATWASLANWVAETEAAGGPDWDAVTFYQEAREVADVALWGVQFYLEQYGGGAGRPGDLGRLVPIAIEAPFSVPLIDSRGRPVQHLRFAGVWDLVAYDPDCGDVVIYDHKTTASDTSGLDIKADLDPQMAGYLYALRHELATNPERFLAVIRPQLGHHPRAQEAMDAITATGAAAPVIGRVCYNVIRKRKPAVPKVNQDGTVSVAAIDTLASWYQQALDTQALTGKPVNAKQADLLARLEGKGPAAYVSRREFWRTTDDVERWRVAAFAQATDMRAAGRDPRMAYRNPGHCGHAWSMSCAYRSICVDESPEAMAHYTVRARHTEVDAANERMEAMEGGE